MWRKEERVGRWGRSKQPWGQTARPPLADSRLSLAQKAPHLTPLSQAPDGLSPTRGRRSLGLGRALADSLSPSLPTTSTDDCWSRGKLPSLQKRERSNLGSAPNPVEMAQTDTKTPMLFTSRPDRWPSIHFASWNVLLCSLLLSLLGQSEYKSKV